MTVTVNFTKYSRNAKAFKKAARFDKILLKSSDDFDQYAKTKFNAVIQYKNSETDSISFNSLSEYYKFEDYRKSQGL